MTTNRPIRRLLIANRGEIARRIMRTARDRGIVCVAVYSDPDRDAPYVAEADQAVALGGITSAESYLDHSKILAAAALTDCDAIHPGYGFLSENASFAREVQEAGLTWIGPDAASISAMAEKVPAKRLVAASGVPLVPGAELGPHEADPAALLRVGEGVRYPLMVKASAGGGGKGMRIVGSPEELPEAVDTARREAQASFGDDTVFLERYLPRARHIEVQVFGDRHGNVVHLFERECSIQRRHQKIVEEAPAPWLSDHVREGLHRAAVAAARAVDYVGAGTVEFMVDGDEFYFLEMNTRLQVEHPVTEEITGLDLVAWQLDVAEGHPLPTPPAHPDGHAIEVRIYAEDPSNGDLPATGTILEFTADDPRIRVDAGVAAGYTITPYYDPMVAKFIAHGATRTQAAARLAAGTRAARIHGLTTNRDMLVAILESDAFAREASSTAFLSEHPEVRTPVPSPRTLRAHALAAADAAWRELRPSSAPPLTPAWRNVLRPGGVTLTIEGPDACHLTAGEDSGRGISVHRRPGRDGGTLWGISDTAEQVGTHAGDVAWHPAEVEARGRATAVVDHDGVRDDIRVTVRPAGRDALDIWCDDPRDHTRWHVAAPGGDRSASAGGGGPAAPVPGTVVSVAVEVGDEVEVGAPLVVMEAMKMEHTIAADVAGVVTEVLVAPGNSVEAHQVLVVVEGTPE